MMRKFLSLLPLFFLSFSCFNNTTLVLTFLPFQLQGTAYAHVIPDTTAAFDDQHRYHHHSDESIVLGNHLKPNQHPLSTHAAATSSKEIKSHLLRNQHQFIQTKIGIFVVFLELVFTNSISRSEIVNVLLESLEAESVIPLSPPPPPSWSQSLNLLLFLWWVLHSPLLSLFSTTSLALLMITPFPRPTPVF
jgi:hypothetical protein